MDTPGDRLVNYVKQWLKDFSKTKFAIPTIVALTCLVYYAVVTSFTVVCFSNLIAPLLMLGLLWASGVRRVRKLLLIGAIAYVIFSMILSVVVVTQLQHVDPIEARTSDGKVVGSLDPWYVDEGVPFTFKLRANLTDSNMVVGSAHVQLIGINSFDSSTDNLTMTLETQYVSNVTNVAMYNFTLTTTTTSPISQFLFRLDLNGTWTTVGDYVDGETYYIQGPTFKDSWAVAGPVTVSAFQIDLFYVFGPYAMVLGMIWWTRRARRMRQKQVEKWQAEHEKDKAEKPKTTSKVQSLDAAMGKVDEGFVCSECGSDVPADATVCPKCGEKFD
jgi:ribosomal protein L40E